MKNISYGPGGIRIEDTSSPEPAVFYSRLLDSREKQALWHRIVVESENLGDASIRFTFYVSEQRSIKIDETVYDIGEVISHRWMPLERKEEILGGFEVKRVLNPRDMLITEAKGRYLWFKVELFPQGDESPSISRMKVFLQSLPWVGYLPEIYQGTGDGSSFTERFLSIFQSISDDMDDKLDHISAYFDPEIADSEVLQWLATWIDIDDPFIWSEEQLRYLVQNSVRLYRRRGTRQAVSDMVELYTGKKPYIVEQYEVEKFRENDRLYGLMHRLYGDHAYQFTVIVSEECVPSTAEFRTLLRVIEGVKPANVEVNLVVLKPYIFLSRYSYIGVNSFLGQYRTANLDGFSTLPFTNIADQSQDEDADIERKGE